MLFTKVPLIKTPVSSIESVTNFPYCVLIFNHHLGFKVPLVGFGTAKNITGCRNFGTVTGKDYTTGSGNATGGIVRRNENAAANLKVTDCNNYGEVIGKIHAGAIAGASYNGAATITNCDNYRTYSAPTKSHIIGQYKAFSASGCDDYSAD